MTHRLHAVWISILALGLAGGALYHQRTSSRTAAAGAVAAAAAAAAGAPTATALPRAGWERGIEYVHALDYQFGLAAEASPSPQQPLLHAAGQWKSVVVERQRDSVKLAVQLQGVKIDAPDEAGAKLVIPTTLSLAQPFYVEYDARGRALRLYLRPDIDTLALGILRELVSISQFSSPASPSTTWQSLEADQAGEYRADYRSLGQAKYSRAKTGYVRAAAAQGSAAIAGVTPVIRQATAKFRLDDWGRTASLEALHVLVTPDVGGGVGVVSRSELRLTLLSQRRGAEIPAPLTGLVPVSVMADPSELVGADTDSQLVGDATVSSLLAELARLPADDRGGSVALQRRLAALFRLRPDAIAEAMAQLDDRNASIILGALGEAGTPAAQRAVASVASDDRLDETRRQMAVDAMLSVQHPTAELREGLARARKSQHPDLRSNASLMLGVMAARDEEPSAAKGIVEELSRDAQNAETTGERIDAISSLGNTRSDAALPALADAMDEEDAELRSAAASALRFVPDAGADQLLSKALTSDKDPGVRRAALVAAGYRAYDPLASALETVSKHDPDAAVRSQAVSTLSSIAHQDPQSLLLLDWVAQNDSDPQVRERARRALGSSTL